MFFSLTKLEAQALWNLRYTQVAIKWKKVPVSGKRDVIVAREKVVSRIKTDIEDKG